MEYLLYRKHDDELFKRYVLRRIAVSLENWQEIKKNKRFSVIVANFARLEDPIIPLILNSPLSMEKHKDFSVKVPHKDRLIAGISPVNCMVRSIKFENQEEYNSIVGSQHHYNFSEVQIKLPSEQDVAQAKYISIVGFKILEGSEDE